MGEIFVAIILIVSGISVAFFYQEQKKLIVLYIAAITIIMGLVYSCPDYGAYKRYFYLSQFFNADTFDVDAARWYGFSSDIGYMAINNFFYEIGVSYGDFRFITSLISLMIIGVVVYKTTNNISFVMGLYIIYPLAMDVCQVRNFMADVILFVTLSFYARWPRYKILIFVSGVIVASLLHKSFLLYMPFIVFEIMRSSKFGKYLYRFALAIGLLMPLYEHIIIGNLDSYALLFSDAGNFSDVQGYMLGETRLGFWVAYIKLLLILSVAYYIYKNIKEHKKVLEFKDRYIEVVYRLIQYMCIISPLIGITATMFRYPRNLLLPLYIACGIFLDYQENNKHRKYYALAAGVVFVLVMYIESFGGFDTFTAILDNNMLFDLLK